MDRAALMQRKDFLFTEALAVEAFPNFKLKPWLTRMLSKDKGEYFSALDELNNAWKVMYPSDNVTYFPQFARSQVFMAMNDYQTHINLDDEPMHMRVFLAFHNQIVKHENNSQKEEKKRSKVEQKERKIKKVQEQKDYLRAIINKGRIRMKESKKQKRQINKFIDEVVTKPKKEQNIMFTLEFVNNEVPYVDLSTWAVQIHSDDKAIRDSAHESLNEAFSLRFPESNHKFKDTQALNRIVSGLETYESIVPKVERSLSVLTFRKIVNSYRARRREMNNRVSQVSQVSQEILSSNLNNNGLFHL